MTEYTVTGIRYAMGEGLSFEEKTHLAKDFVESLELGQEVILKANPTNPADKNAVMVFVDYEFRGYIAREQCLEVHQLLNENKEVDAVVSRVNEELAFFVTIPGAAERNIQSLPLSRQLPDSPLGSDVRMPFSLEEIKLEMLGNKLAGMELTKDSFMDFIKIGERYESLLDMAICYTDNQRLSLIYNTLYRIRGRKDIYEIYVENVEPVENLYTKLRDRVRNMRRRWNKGLENSFIHHLDCLRANSSLTSLLYKKYCETFLNATDFAEADKNLMHKERERLLKWFHDMAWSELRNPEQLEKMASKMGYLRLSREEYYDVFSVLLILEQLDAYCQGEEIVAGDEITLPKDLDTKRARQYFVRAIEKKYMEKVENGKYRWVGTNDKGSCSELAYFCGKVYDYKHTDNGNAGNNFPEESLNKLFGVTRLYSSLTQVYNAKRKQRWRSLIDDIFE